MFWGHCTLAPIRSAIPSVQPGRQWCSQLCNMNSTLGGGMGLHASVGYKLWLNGDPGKLCDYDKWVNAMESTNGRSENRWDVLKEVQCMQSKLLLVEKYGDFYCGEKLKKSGEFYGEKNWSGRLGRWGWQEGRCNRKRKIWCWSFIGERI